MKKSIVCVLSCLSLVTGAGCGAEPVEAPRAELAQKVNRYARALLAEDEADFARVTSARVAGRLHQARFQALGVQGARSPLASERAGLLRVVGSAENFGEGFTVTGLEQVTPETVSVELAFQGQPVPKPFFFVLEGGEYKAQVKPLQEVSALGMEKFDLGWGSYRATNSSDISHTISCTPYGTDYSNYKLPFSASLPKGSSVKLSCADQYCPGSPIHDGADFHPDTALGTYVCAYQTFGADFKFENGRIGCAQDC